MILLDFSGSAFASIAVDLNRTKTTNADINFLRHLLLQQLLSYKKRFSEKYGELIICCESLHGNWRKNIFPEYKAKRKEQRDKSLINWKSIFDSVDIILEEIKENLPYKVMQVDGLEADDIIALLTKKAYEILPTTIMEDLEYPILIISNDKDFKQLHKFHYVTQYCPAKQAFYKEQEPEKELQELIIRGDKSDGIPNIKSPIRSFVDETRQTPITTKFMRDFRELGLQILSESELERYNMNKLLISFDCIPDRFIPKVKEEFYKTKKIDKFQLLRFLMAKGLKELAENVDEF